jgi:hypothetical protein
MGHLNHRALLILRDIIIVIPVFRIEQHGVCKNSKDTFPSSDYRCKEILDLVHSNVCRPISVASILGSELFVTVWLVHCDPT